MKLIKPTVVILLISALPYQPLQAGNSFFDQFKSDFQKALTEGVSQTSKANDSANGNHQIGIARNASNVRSGPGAGNAKVATLPAGTQMTILGSQGQWHRISAMNQGQPVSGWIYAPLVEVKSGGSQISRTGSAGAAATAAPIGTMAGKSTISYAGYAKEFLPVKRMMENGDLAGVERFYTEREKQSSNNNGFNRDENLLHSLEQGTLAIDRGDYSGAEEGFSTSERILQDRKNQSSLVDWSKTALLTPLEFLSGNQELQDYPGEGYERVLMLNYKSIAYLLQGKREAYNVTRRAIDWQNDEKRAFEESLREAEEKLQKERKTQAEQAGKAQGALYDSRITQDYADQNAKAVTVPSAYVNPFGYYMAGMVQEYESYDDWSLRENARISYTKALGLNPGSRVLKQAVKDMKQSSAPSSRLVHVVVADGFVPEKKMLTYTIAAQNETIPIKLTKYEADPSSVRRIEVQTVNGTRLAVLSPVADIEAICLRQQKDMEPFRQVKVLLAVASGIVVNSAAKNIPIFGGILSKKREEMAAPDMRSWMSLPATIQAARLRLNRGVTKLKIVTYNRKGQRLASRTVNINGNSHDFVYARSLDKTMYAYAAKKLWMVAGQ